MIHQLTIETEGTEARYVPAPCIGTVTAARVVWQTNVVEPNDTVEIARGADVVNTITAVDTAGLQCEEGVPTDSALQYLIFDPDSATKANSVILVTADRAGVDAIVTIDFDDSAYVEQAASEA